MIFLFIYIGDPLGGLVAQVHGTLFFGSTKHFLELFPPTRLQSDPCEVRLVFETGHVADYSAVQAVG